MKATYQLLLELWRDVSNNFIIFLFRSMFKASFKILTFTENLYKIQTIGNTHFAFVVCANLLVFIL